MRRDWRRPEMGHTKCRMRGARNEMRNLELRIRNKNPAELQLLFELFDLGFDLLPERFLGCFFAAFNKHRNHLLDSRNVDSGTLGLTALAIGDGPIHNFGLEGILDADEIFAAHLAEWFLSGV